MEKQEPNELIIYGKQPVFEALRSDHLITKIVIAREIEKKDIQKILSLAEKKILKSPMNEKLTCRKYVGRSYIRASSP